MGRLPLSVAFAALLVAAVLVVTGCGDDRESILMLHTADSGVATSNGDGTFLLMLRVVDEVIWFADHPGRRAGTMSLQELIEIVEEAASDDPLNASLEAGGFLYPVELLGAAPGSAEGSISYIVRPLDEAIIEGPSQLAEFTAIKFDAATLFIDAGPSGVNSQITD